MSENAFSDQLVNAVKQFVAKEESKTELNTEGILDPNSSDTWKRVQISVGVVWFLSMATDSCESY